MKYAYSTRLYDDGRIIFGGVIAVDDTAKSTEERKDRFDVYIDVFDTRDEACTSLRLARDEAYPGFSEQFPEAGR